MTSRPAPSRGLHTLLLALAVAVVIGFGLLVLNPATRNTLTERLTIPDTAATDDAAADASAVDQQLNIAIIGVGGESHHGGGLADAIMLASIDPVTAKAVLLSIPRDLYLTLEDGSRMRINQALLPADAETAEAYGERVRRVFTDAFNVPVQHFVRLDFAAFVMVVDALGGVDVEFKRPLYDAQFATTHGVLAYSAGRHHLDGDEALHVARSRKTSSRGDLDRAARQRAILMGLRDRISSLDALANPAVLSSLLEAQRQHVQTDLDVFDWLRLYNVAKDMDMNDVATRGFEDSAAPLVANATIGGAEVLVPETGDFTRIRSFMQQAIASR